MLAAILFQSPIVFALLLVICGLLLGYALGTGRIPESDALVSMATWLKAQSPAPASSAPEPAASAEGIASWAGLPPDPLAAPEALASLQHERMELSRALQSAQDDIEDLQEDLAGHRRALETIERYRNEALDDLAREKDRVSGLESRCREQEQLLARHHAAEDERSILRTRNACLQSELEAAREGYRQAQLEWKAAGSELAHYQDQIRALGRQQRSTELEMEKLRQDRESLLASLRGAQEQNRLLSQQLGDHEAHAQQLREEIEGLRVLQMHWESRALWRPDDPHPEAVHAVDHEPDADRVQALEELVTTLREQLRLVQLQAQEMVQRRQEVLAGREDSPGDVVDRQAGGAISSWDSDRRERVARIHQQQRQLGGQEDAA